MAKEKYTPVTFEDSQGNVISNDPVFLARKVLADAGQGAEVDEDEDTDEDMTEPAEKAEDYKSFDAAALKELATERGVDIEGLTKVREVRAALMAADAAEADAE